MIITKAASDLGSTAQVCEENRRAATGACPLSGTEAAAAAGAPNPPRGRRLLQRRGRPAVELENPMTKLCNETLIKALDCLSGAGCTFTAAAKACGCDSASLWRWIKKDDESVMVHGWPDEDSEPTLFRDACATARRMSIIQFEQLVCERAALGTPRVLTNQNGVVFEQDERIILSGDKPEDPWFFACWGRTIAISALIAAASP